MNKQEKQAEIVIFTSSKGQVKLRDFHNETLWATQAEIADFWCWKISDN